MQPYSNLAQTTVIGEGKGVTNPSPVQALDPAVGVLPRDGMLPSLICLKCASKFFSLDFPDGRVRKLPPNR